MDAYDYMNQDVCWGSENPRQNPYTNDSYNYECYSNYPCDEWGHNYSCNNDGYVNQCYYDDPYSESYDNDWGCNENSIQNQYQESSPFSEKQERSDFTDKLDQMLEMSKKFNEQQEKSSDQWEKSLLNIQKHLTYISEQLSQQPLDNPSDTTRESEVSFLSSDELYDDKVHKPTPPEVEVVEDYVSLDDKDTEGIIESKEVVTESEKSQTTFHELVTPKVGEGFVEANTTLDPMNLKEHENQPLVVMETKRPMCFKQPNIIIDRPLLTTIYTQNSCLDCTIDVTFGDQKLRLLLFEPTNDPPISGDLVVINTIDDYVYEHTANMLSDTTRTLENCLPCFRLKALDLHVSQKVKKKFPNKTHDASHSNKSKMKVLNGIKSRIKYSRQRNKATRLGLHKKKNESMTFDPGGSRFTYDPP